MINLFNGCYRGKKVLVTGHTGFKGSWLSLWLEKMGASVIGYSLPAPTTPSHFELLDLNLKSHLGDIRDYEKLLKVVKDTKPDIVFHLAAQPLVRYSYGNPMETFETNVMGTVNLFEVCKQVDSVKAIVNITSDKCYENSEWVWGYRERDPMGGHDPYSASKGCSELVTSSYRNSFFTGGKKLLASVRAGNVIGGGDWAEDRLIPDIMKAAKDKKVITIRNPKSTRPWQHVLEPLSGYLLVGQRLIQGDRLAATGWNFGPFAADQVPVGKIAEELVKFWDNILFDIHRPKDDDLHEANSLRLDCSKANSLLHWRPVWSFDQMLERTANWYKNYYLGSKLNSIDDLLNYVESAKKINLSWTDNN